MKGIFGKELYHGFRYGTELSGYAKTVRLGGIIHSDEDLKSYSFMEEIKEIEKLLGVKEGDGWVLVVGDDEQCKKGLQVIYDRAYLTHVPEETRKADPDGCTSYLRPLPGAERMYPETDIPPFKVNKEFLNAIEIADFGKTKEKLRKLLNEELAEKMLKSERLGLFEKIIEKEGKRTDPTLVAVTLENTMTSIRREGLETEIISAEKIAELFEIYSTGAFVKAAIPEILRELARNPKINISEIIDKKGLKRISGFKLRELMRSTETKNIGDIMQKYRLQVDVEEVSNLIKESNTQKSKKIKSTKPKEAKSRAKQKETKTKAKKPKKI